MVTAMAVPDLYAFSPCCGIFTAQFGMGCASNVVQFNFFAFTKL
jgi:hypothetical protein